MQLHSPQTCAHQEHTDCLTCTQNTRDKQNEKQSKRKEKQNTQTYSAEKKVFSRNNISASMQKQCETCRYTHHKHAHTKYIHMHTKNIRIVQHARKAHTTNRTKTNPNVKKKNIQTYSAEKKKQPKTIFQSTFKSNAKHAATLIINMCTPRTCMRTPRTHWFNMHVKLTRQTERKKIINPNIN